MEAQELADLLTSQGIPICILNACQSGKQRRSLSQRTGLTGIEKRARWEDGGAGDESGCSADDFGGADGGGDGL